jgi:2-iminobutanoate/2-iminopropanoate deaminase
MHKIATTLLAAAGLTLHAGAAMAELEVKRFNPDGFSKPDGYVQVVTVKGDHKEIYLGGKAGLNADDTIVPGGLGPQARLTFQRIEEALKAAGAKMTDVVELQIYIVDLQKQDPSEAYQAVRDAFPAGFKPVSMVIGVSALAIPGLLIEVNVKAVVPG